VQSDSIFPAQRQYGGPASAARKLWAEGGLRRFYRGFTPCLLRAVPANGVMLLTVDKVTQMLSRESATAAAVPAGAAAVTE
jgi:solute carrier family 25 carnitine/acylcarnitine transporter 20/29